jgi:hypothetical protein
MTDSIDVEEYREYLKTGQMPMRLLKKSKPKEPAAKPATARVHTPGQMNKTEARYAEQLEAWRLSGEITSWMFEPLKLRLAKRTYYSPDFLVVRPDGAMEFHEVKGHWEDDARVKVKVAAEKFPMFTFIAITHKRGEWVNERF